MKRRAFLAHAGALAAASALPVRESNAAPDGPARLGAAIRDLAGARAVTAGRVELDLPPLVENGNTVPLTIVVDSPMTAGDHVRAIHVFAEKNPQALVAVFHLGPRAGRARVATRIRLADSQRIVAIAEMSDGALWSGSADSIVTISACVDAL
jgi:sulfur-oxidizing protein SoxY